MIPLLFAALAQAQECQGEPASPADFVALMDQAEQAYADFEGERFQETMDEAAFRLPCLDAPLSPTQSARYHQLQGLRQFGVREEERAAQAFAAARDADPDVVLGDELVPAGHAIRELHARIPLDNGGHEPMPVPVEGEVLLNGAPAEDRPTDWPTLFQLQDPQGAILNTTYLLPGDALPTYEGVLPEPPPLANIGWIQSRRQLAFLASGLGAAVAAGGTYGVAAWSAASYEQAHPEWTLADLERSERVTNGLVLGSAGLGLAAVALTTTSFLVVEW